MCITELADSEHWVDMPLGAEDHNETAALLEGDDVDDDLHVTSLNAQRPYSDEQGGEVDVNERSFALFPHGKLVKCRILQASGKHIEASLRESRVVRSWPSNQNHMFLI